MVPRFNFMHMKWVRDCLWASGVTWGIARSIAKLGIVGLSRKFVLPVLQVYVERRKGGSGANMTNGSRVG